MNNKITSERFKNFISYDFWKMVLAIVAVIIVVGLTMRITSPMPTYAQEFTMMVDSAIITSDEGRNLLNDVKSKDVSNYGFSYDILTTKTFYITTGQHSPSFLMHTYEKAYHDDIFICADIDENSLYKNYISSFYANELTSYVNEAISFANGFYAQDGSLDEQKVKDYFASKRGKDARFISDNDYFNAVNNECLRITAIKENATKLKYVFENYDILYNYEELESYGEIVATGYYAIDFSKLNNYKRQDKSLQNAFSRIRDLGEGNYESTLDNVLLLIGGNYEISGDLHYEGLAVINTILQTYTTLLD